MNTNSFDSFDNNTYLSFCTPAQIQRDLQTLVGIVIGIACDREINSSERPGLANWMDKIKQYNKVEPYRSIITKITDALYDNIITQEEVQDIVWVCHNYINKSNYYDLITRGIQKLHGILEGIIIDNVVNHSEINFLESWLEDNSKLQNCWPYDELYSFLTKVTADKIITADEQKSILAFCNAIVGNNTESDGNVIIDLLNEGYCQVDPTIIIQEKTFCITGNSQKYKRREIAEKIELFGGFVIDKVSGKLDYLIVCDEKNSCWAYTCYGRKIENVIKLRKSGHRIAIVHEFDLYDRFNDLE